MTIRRYPLHPNASNHILKSSRLNTPEAYFRRSVGKTVQNSKWRDSRVGVKSEGSLGRDG